MFGWSFNYLHVQILLHVDAQFEWASSEQKQKQVYKCCAVIVFYLFSAWNMLYLADCEKPNKLQTQMNTRQFEWVSFSHMLMINCIEIHYFFDFAMVRTSSALLLLYVGFPRVGECTKVVKASCTKCAGTGVQPVACN